ncbi:MAG: aquaporin [Ignavibacteriales bacterium]|nr:aquaporin [Ignavibacteriales bacterium]
MKQKALVAEFIGTFGFVFISVGAIAADQMLSGRLGPLALVLASGIALAAMMSATAAISGGHLNPAITFGLFLARKIDRGTAISYVISQCLGALVAMMILQLTMPTVSLAAVWFGTPKLGVNISLIQGLAAEFVLTFFLMFVFYGTMLDQRGPKLGGLFVGLVSAVSLLVAGPISGGAFNPARHFGPALISGTMDNFWIYWIGPAAGAALAALVYNLILERQ